MVKEKKKNYALKDSVAMSLSEYSLKMSKKTGIFVSKQMILEVLVSLMKNKDIYNKVFNSIENEK